MEARQDGSQNGTETVAAFHSVNGDRNSALERAKELVLEYGWNSTSFQIINPGIERWFASGGDAVVGFVSAGDVRVVAGAPVCSEHRLAEAAAEFERDAAKQDQRVCYFAAEQRLESIYSGSKDHSKVLLGAQPVWHPADWAGLMSKHRSLRAQFNRARNKGVTVSEWPTERAVNNPALADCLRAWLESKGLPPLHFMVEPDTLGRLANRRVFVAEQDGDVAGFIVLSPVATRNGWLFEQFPHRPGAPNGTVELMIDTAMRAMAADDNDYATLGLAPLSKRAEIEPFENPLWLRIVLAWMRKHGQRFYNFNGLDAFKSKLQPERWEPVFAIANEPQFSAGTLYSIARAFSEDHPIRLLTGGLARAAATEISWLKTAIVGK
jgi:phosphatidylglycerol lysyltransferase